VSSFHFRFALAAGLLRIQPLPPSVIRRVSSISLLLEVPFLDPNHSLVKVKRSTVPSMRLFEVNFIPFDPLFLYSLQFSSPFYAILLQARVAREALFSASFSSVENFLYRSHCTSLYDRLPPLSSGEKGFSNRFSLFPLNLFFLGLLLKSDFLSFFRTSHDSVVAFQ